MRKNEVIDLLTGNAINERFDEIVSGNEEINAATKHSMKLFKELTATLSAKQDKLFDAYMTAEAEEQSKREYLIYQQGLKDMANLNESLYDRTDREKSEKLLELLASDNKDR